MNSHVKKIQASFNYYKIWLSSELRMLCCSVLTSYAPNSQNSIETKISQIFIDIIQTLWLNSDYKLTKQVIKWLHRHKIIILMAMRHKIKPGKNFISSKGCAWNVSASLTAKTLSVKFVVIAGWLDSHQIFHLTEFLTTLDGLYCVSTQISVKFPWSKHTYAKI